MAKISMGLCARMRVLSLKRLQNILCAPSTDNQSQRGQYFRLLLRDNSTLLGQQVASFSHQVANVRGAIRYRGKWVTLLAAVLRLELPLSGRPDAPYPSNPLIPSQDSHHLLANVLDHRHPQEPVLNQMTMYLCSQLAIAPV